MLVTVGFSSPWMKLLLGAGGGGGYFLMPNFVCKHKEMSMTQLNILERHGFFIVLLLYYTMPCSLLVCSSVIFSHKFLHSVLKPFVMVTLYMHGISIPSP